MSLPPTPQPCPTVLGNAALEDVQIRDDLEARDHRRVPGARDVHDVAQDPVDPDADMDSVALRLDVDVARTFAGREREDPVHQAHRGRIVHVDGVEVGIRRLVLVGEVAQRILVLALGPDAAEGSEDLGRGADTDVERRHSGDGADVVQRHDVHGVDDRDEQPVPDTGIGEDAQLLGERLGDQPSHVPVRLQAGDVEQRQPVDRGQAGRDADLGHEPELEQRGTEPSSRPVRLMHERRVELLARDEPELKQGITEAGTVRGRERVCRGECGRQSGHEADIGRSTVQP